MQPSIVGALILADVGLADLLAPPIGWATMFALAKLAKAKLAKPSLTKAKLPTTRKLVKHCLGFSLRCHKVFVRCL